LICASDGTACLVWIVNPQRTWCRGPPTSKRSGPIIAAAALSVTVVFLGFAIG
jgi:hypothetical protein